MIASRGQHGFTLIELLVVIGIIGLLVSILLPALGAARDVARSGVCMSNNRQMGLALELYADANDGYFVPYWYFGTTHRIWWFGGESGGGGGSRPLDVTLSPLARYFGGDIVEGLACPDFPADDGGFVAKFSNRSAHYGYNIGLGGWTDLNGNIANPSRRSEVARPGATLSFADALHMDGLTQGSSLAFYEPHYVAAAEPGGWGGHAHLRHGERANVAFLDGHVEAYQPDGEVFRAVAGSPFQALDDEDGPDSIFGFDTDRYN